MTKQLDRCADLAGLLGILVCVLAGIARLFGSYALGGFETLTLFQIGIGMMVAACFIKLWVLGQR
ncbi:MAG: hypothetical protein IT494_05580 [Gammaproteobacteria bacterium]|nr:hypothetical protein [Gammaproteobacteria bacterium]